MKNSTILLASISLGLAACDGGGGGTTTDGSSTNQLPTTVNRTPSGIPVLKAAEGSKRVGYLNAEVYRENMPAPPAQYKPANFTYNAYFKYRMPNGQLAEVWNNAADDEEAPDLIIIDGKPETTESYRGSGGRTFNPMRYDVNLTGNKAVSSLAYLGPDGKSYAGYQIYDDEAQYYDVKAHEVGSHRWTNIDYHYTTAIEGQKPDEEAHYASDGTITINGADWDAVLGNVTLDGKISGTDVAGTATGKFYGQTLTGEFAGYDGTSRPKGSDKTYQPGTIGGFIGQNDTAVFSGGWVSYEESQFLQ